MKNLSNFGLTPASSTGGTGVVEHPEIVNLVEGINPITHTAGWKPKSILISWPDEYIAGKENNSTVSWYTLAATETTIVYINSDGIYNNLPITLVK